ncbi:hypothetical protein EWJ82_20085 [Salmonella enterica subsp. enterica serovar Weybridge]|nr:hypothetical protein [Salmonella enterica subsp. enterica serovar Weybridge]
MFFLILVWLIFIFLKVYIYFFFFDICLFMCKKICIADILIFCAAFCMINRCLIYYLIVLWWYVLICFVCIVEKIAKIIFFKTNICI